MVAEPKPHLSREVSSFAWDGLRGRITPNASLAPFTWFRVGGAAELVFRPADREDLSCFLKQVVPETPVQVVGVASNLIVRDGGVPGVVVRLMGTAFTQIEVDPPFVRVGAGALDRTVAETCRTQGIKGLEFLVGIPGTIGGAVRMNAGAYGVEMKDIVASVEAMDSQGGLHTLTPEECGFSYRSSALPEDWIVTAVICKGEIGMPSAIEETMQCFLLEREKSQPVRARTGGSTFKNPEDRKAWRLIDDAGCRGLMRGGAQVSPLHCNFLINTGAATAADIETLGEEVRQRVFDNSGVMLEWEIKRIGIPLASE